MHRLTSRQKQIIDLQGRGLSYKEIASRLNLSLSSVKAHVSNALARTGAVSGHALQKQVRDKELGDFAATIKSLADASSEFVRLQRTWPSQGGRRHLE